MRAAVVTFPGSNRDRDLRDTFAAVFGSEPLALWHTQTELPPLDVIGIPGGFSFGDYLRCGAIAARSPVMREIARFAERGGYVVGICNGFQVLTESGLLPGALIANAGLKFVSRSVRLGVTTTATPFTRAYAKDQVIDIPVAHHDGNYVIDRREHERLVGEDRIAFRYVDNPNGSTDDIAGLVNEKRNVLGLMPHPECRIEPLQGGSDGRALFESILRTVGA